VGGPAKKRDRWGVDIAGSGIGEMPMGNRWDRHTMKGKLWLRLLVIPLSIIYGISNLSSTNMITSDS